MKFISVEIDLHGHFLLLSLLLFLDGDAAHMLIFGHVLKIFNSKTAEGHRNCGEGGGVDR